MIRLPSPARPLACASSSSPLVLLTLAEGLCRALLTGAVDPAALGPLASPTLGALTAYWRTRAWALAHPWPLGLGSAAGVLLVLVAARQGLLLWSALKARVTGTAFQATALSFPLRRVDLLREIRRRPPGHTFVGLSPRRGAFGWRWRPVYLSPRQRTTHRHVIGKTGSGKTASVLWPGVLQDALDGKGVLVMSAKGSDEEVGTMKAIAALDRTDRAAPGLLAARLERARALQPHLQHGPRAAPDTRSRPAATWWPSRSGCSACSRSGTTCSTGPRRR